MSEDTSHPRSRLWWMSRFFLILGIIAYISFLEVLIFVIIRWCLGSSTP